MHFQSDPVDSQSRGSLLFVTLLFDPPPLETILPCIKASLTIVLSAFWYSDKLLTCCGVCGGFLILQKQISCTPVLCFTLVASSFNVLGEACIGRSLHCCTLETYHIIPTASCNARISDSWTLVVKNIFGSAFRSSLICQDQCCMALWAFLEHRLFLIPESEELAPCTAYSGSKALNMPVSARCCTFLVRYLESSFGDWKSVVGPIHRVSDHSFCPASYWNCHAIGRRQISRPGREEALSRLMFFYSGLN